MKYFDPANPQLGDVIFHANNEGCRIFDIRHPDAIKDNVGVVCDVTGPQHGPLLQYGIKVQMLDGSITRSVSREWRSFRDLEHFLSDYSKETHNMQEKLEVMSEKICQPQEEKGGDAGELLAQTRIDADVADLDM